MNISCSTTQLSKAVYKSCDEELTGNAASLLGVVSAIINADPERFKSMPIRKTQYIQLKILLKVYQVNRRFS